MTQKMDPREFEKKTQDELDDILNRCVGQTKLSFPWRCCVWNPNTRGAIQARSGALQCL